jgi:predicted nucleic acid-binding protein
MRSREYTGNMTVETQPRAVMITERYNLSIYDATILASAIDAVVPWSTGSACTSKLEK